MTSPPSGLNDLVAAHALVAASDALKAGVGVVTGVMLWGYVVLAGRSRSLA